MSYVHFSKDVFATAVWGWQFFVVPTVFFQCTGRQRLYITCCRRCSSFNCRGAVDQPLLSIWYFLAAVL